MSLRKCGLVLGAIVLAALAMQARPGHLGLAPSEAEAAFPGADNLQASVSCLPTGRVRLLLDWSTYSRGQQWVDLTIFNNGFAPGTFIGAGPLSPGEHSFYWDGLLANTVHYVRVNTFTSQGWVASNTVGFVTPQCSSSQGSNYPGADSLSLQSQACAANGEVTATLDWRSYNAGPQWVDVSEFNNNFAPGTFTAVGGISGSQSRVDFAGLDAETRHYARVNTLTAYGWVSSSTISFMTRDCDQTSPGNDFSTSPRDIDGNLRRGETATLVDVRFGAHPNEGFDRIVFEFRGGIPDASIRYVNSAAACGSGRPIRLDGEEILQARFSDSRAHNNSGQPTIDETEISGSSAGIVEAKQYCDFEGVVGWVMGIDEDAPFRVTTLSNPPRIVIDVAR